VQWRMKEGGVGLVVAVEGGHHYWHQWQEDPIQFCHVLMDLSLNSSKIDRLLCW